MLFPAFYDIKVHSQNAKNGKIGCFSSVREGGSPAESLPGKLPLGSPGSGPREGDGGSAVTGNEVRVKRRECGWYRGRVAFRPK